MVDDGYRRLPWRRCEFSEVPGVLYPLVPVRRILPGLPDARLPESPRRPTTPPYCLDGFCPSGGPNELWSYGEEAYEILKKYVQIRENLRPYIFKHLQKASQDGTPLMRPLFYDFPEEKNYGHLR